MGQPAALRYDRFPASGENSLAAGVLAYAGAALAAKPFAALLPRGGHLVYAWVALCFVLQPLAAVFALRCAGVRGWVAPLAGGVPAVCMPAFIFRFGHAALWPFHPAAGCRASGRFMWMDLYLLLLVAVVLVGLGFGQPWAAAADGNLTVTLDIAEPVRPDHLMGNGKLRPLGFLLSRFRLDRH